MKLWLKKWRPFDDLGRHLLRLFAAKIGKLFCHWFYMGPPYPHFCFLHFGGKGTEFSSPNCSKPLCHKGFPFCHYYTLMALLCGRVHPRRRWHKDHQQQPGPCHRGHDHGYLRPLYRRHAQRFLPEDAGIQRTLQKSMKPPPKIENCGKTRIYCEATAINQKPETLWFIKDSRLSFWKIAFIALIVKRKEIHAQHAA